jgi:AcrR family transcriptional regulator
MQKSTPPEERGTTPRRGRGRPRAFDRDAALGEAVRLFWRKGYEATSMADLTAAMGIGAPSLYAAFGSKEALYAESLCHYQKKFGPLTWGRFDAAPTARAAVEGWLLDSAAALTGGAAGEARGCMLTLSAIDGEAHAELCETVRTSRLSMQARLAERFAQAIAAGEIAPATDAAALARYIQTVQNGMSILARDGASRAELEAVTRVAMNSWDATTRPAVPHSDKAGTGAG